MLHLYTKKELIPKDIEFVLDADAFFNVRALEDNEFNRKVLEEYEFGKYLDDSSFIDRLGFKLPNRYISTSSKVLMNINSYPDKCINAVEMGVDAYAFLVYIENGHAYISERDGWAEDAFFDYKGKSVDIDGEVLSW